MAGVQNIVSGKQATATSSASALRTLAGLGRKFDPRDPGVARQAAGQFVSELFFKPLLSEMRHFPLGRELATGGYTESVFGEQLDQRLADAVTQAETALVSRVTDSLSRGEVRVSGMDAQSRALRSPTQSGALRSPEREGSLDIPLEMYA